MDDKKKSYGCKADSRFSKLHLPRRAESSEARGGEHHPLRRNYSLPILVLLLLTASVSCTRSLEPIAFAVPPLEQNALLYIAEHKGFFAAQGLQVVIKDHDTGVAALQGLLQGEADIAEAAEFPFVRALFQKENVMIVGCNDKFENDYVVARKDRAIDSISDLVDKRIGVALGTINEFYLGRLLTLNGIDIRDVTLLDTKPADYVQAVARGDVDALIAWQPYIHRIQEEVNGVLVWPAQSSQAA